MPSEVSSNLAKFDGVRYGQRVVPEGGGTIEQVVSATRTTSLVTRSSAGSSWAPTRSPPATTTYYGSAQKVRTLVQQDFEAAFEQVDVLVSPASPRAPFRFGEQIDDPVTLYLNDVTTIPANLAGVPGIAVPWVSSTGCPVGVQFMAPATEDARLYRVAGALEALVTEKLGSPIAAQPRCPPPH